MNLERVYDLIKKGEIESALDLVFDQIDDLLCEGDFIKVDEILSHVDISQLDSNLILGFLCVTLAAKDHLSQRAFYYDDCYLHFLESEPERCESLLKGLR